MVNDHLRAAGTTKLSAARPALLPSFKLCKLLQAAMKLLVGKKASLYPCLNEVAHELRADDLRSEAENIGVIVLDALVSRVDIVRKGSPDPTDLVGGHGGPYPCSANKDAPLGLTIQDQARQFPGHVGEIDRLIGICADIYDLMPKLPKAGNDACFTRVTCMIGPNHHVQFGPPISRPECFMRRPLGIRRNRQGLDEFPPSDTPAEPERFCQVVQRVLTD